MPVSNEDYQREAASKPTRKGAKTGARRPGSLSGGAVQRAKMLNATRELTHESGYEGLSASALIAHARVSSKTFYEHFDSAEACFAATFDEAIAETSAIVMPVYQQPGPWLARVRDALHTLLDALDRDPPLATLLFLEAQKGGPEVQERRARVNEMLMMIVGGGRSASASAPPALTDEVLVGGALAVIRARLSRPTHRPLLSLLNELMAVLAHAYLGADAAAEELEKTTVKQPAHKPETGDGSVLPVRLTHRTLAVLAAIAEEPGASNREVSDAAGIADQGQVSRLLGRLESAQLIRNDGEPDRWAPNAWRLTTRGEQVRQTMRRDFPSAGS